MSIMKNQSYLWALVFVVAGMFCVPTRASMSEAYEKGAMKKASDALRKAILSEDEKTVENMLSQGIRADEKTVQEFLTDMQKKPYGETRSSIAQLLFLYGANPDLAFRNEKNVPYTPLAIALEKGDMTLAELLFTQGANIQDVNLLYKAILTSNIPAVKFLLAHGVSNIDEPTLQLINMRLKSARPDTTQKINDLLTIARVIPADDMTLKSIIAKHWAEREEIIALLNERTKARPELEDLPVLIMFDDVSAAQRLQAIKENLSKRMPKELADIVLDY